MVVAYTLMFTATFVLFYWIAYRFLPNFKTEKRIASQASLVVKSSQELQRMKLGSLTGYIADHWIPRFTNLKNPLFNGQLRRMFNVLGKEITFEEDIADKLIKSFIVIIPFSLVPIITQEPMFLVILPIAVIGFFVVQVLEIKNEYKKRQQAITRDLPHLISKMMIALETGKSFTATLQSIEESSGSRMQQMLRRMNANTLVMGLPAAIDLFALETDVPVMRDFAAAVKIGLDNGYSSAKEYFDTIKDDLSALRLAALKDATSAQPEKVKYLLIGVAIFSLFSVGIAFVNIFKQVQNF